MASSLDYQALQVFISTPVTQDMIHKIVVSTLQVLPCKDSKKQTYTANGEVRQLPSLMTFLTKLVRYTNVYTGTLMATLVYLDKLKLRLPKSAQGLPCTRHRILLSCLILLSKFHNDSLPKNHHWARYTDGLFSTKDINLMERQLLYLLNWDLKVDNALMVEQLGSFLEPIRFDLIKTAKMKQFVDRQRREIEEAAHRLGRSPAHYRQGSQLSVSSDDLDVLVMSGSLETVRLHEQIIRQEPMVMSRLQTSLSLSLTSLAPLPMSLTRMPLSTLNMSLSSVGSPDHKTVDPYIEACAIDEEKKLQELLSSLRA